ncbi:hypothetical protein GYH30_022515 [Glycine max]|nr:hypothetical protein GYH30_022515 [Glycine max]
MVAIDADGGFRNFDLLLNLRTTSITPSSSVPNHGFSQPDCFKSEPASSVGFVAIVDLVMAAMLVAVDVVELVAYGGGDDPHLQHQSIENPRILFILEPLSILARSHCAIF